MNNRLETARALTTAAEQKAAELGIHISTTVVDDGGNVVAFSRMDGTQLASSAISQGKAYSAVAFGRPSKDMDSVAQPGQSGYALQAIDSRFVFSGGGLPLFFGGTLTGGIGVSGGSAEQDQLCAEAALVSMEYNSSK